MVSQNSRILWRNIKSFTLHYITGCGRVYKTINIIKLKNNNNKIKKNKKLNQSKILI